MLDNLLVLAIPALVLVAFISGSKLHKGTNPAFFCADTSSALRGMWCLVVMLVHIPAGHTNTVQDMIGSFAYIGVSFFFMTSAYGLTLKIKKNRENLRTFWRSRLPKLVIPNLLINMFAALASLGLFGEMFQPQDIFHINAWVRNLMACYVVFWLCSIFIRDEKKRAFAIGGIVFLLSLTFYFLLKKGIYGGLVWVTEMLGFAWGVLLAEYRDKLTNLRMKNWWLSGILLCAVALVLGALYLKCKPIEFWGDYALKIVLGLSILAFVLYLNTRIDLKGKPLIFLGAFSYEVYLIHEAIFPIIDRMNTPLSSGWFILLCMSVSVVCAAVVHYIAKGLLRLWQRLPWLGIPD